MTVETDEQYTKALARRIQSAVVGLYGVEHELTEDLLETVICEALFHAARDVRAGRTARLEYLGEIVVENDQPQLRPASVLYQRIKEDAA